MADYWKSNERKYCDFCKCWISDNKASVSFHENGKKHKMNMAKRITEISKNSENAEKERQKMESEIRKMEDAAMKSYARDISCRSDMTAVTLNAVMGSSSSMRHAADRSSSSSLNKTKQVDPLRLEGLSDDEDGCRVSIKKVDPDDVPNASLWVEGKTDDGYSYYWNVKTNESIWEAPKEGFLSYEEYARINDIALKQQEMQSALEAKKFRENANEEVARYNRERLKVFRQPMLDAERKVFEEKRESFKTEAEAATPEIGSWQIVEHKPPPEPVDLQLPVLDRPYIAPVVSEVPIEPPVKKFKEKQILKLDDEIVATTSISFKKRKFANKGNARKRLDDD